MEIEESTSNSPPSLVNLSIKSASSSYESIEKWRRQRRTLEKLPSPLAQALFHRLHHRHLLFPSLLEAFKDCIEVINLSGDSLVDAEWMAYLGAFRSLHTLDISDCRGITNSALWALTGMDCLKELDLSRCTKLTDACVSHLLSIHNLEKLSVSETSLTVNGVTQLPSLEKLFFLDLGGLPVTDLAVRSLQVLVKLEYLDIWGSKISNSGAALLKYFPKLRFLNIAWTKVTRVPYLPSLTCINMSNCNVQSIFKDGYNEVKSSNLSRLHLHGVAFIDLPEVFSYIDISRISFLDLSNSPVDDFHSLVNMTALEHLDVSSSKLDDNSVEKIAHVGATVKYLNLSDTRLRSTGIESLTGFLPKIETLILSNTSVDDVALSYIGTMQSLKVLDLSNTIIKGFCHIPGHEEDEFLSLTALQSLIHLERLVLEGTEVRDGALQPLSCLEELKFLFLKSDFITDVSLLFLSSFPKLKVLGIHGAVLTNAGIHLFCPPPMLEILDLRDCWLLTEDALLSFQKNYPQIELKHEHVHNRSTAQTTSYHGSPAPGSSRSAPSKSKWMKMPPPPSQPQKIIFPDERLKYSRQELLELQFSPLSRMYSIDSNLPKETAK